VHSDASLRVPFRIGRAHREPQPEAGAVAHLFPKVDGKARRFETKHDSFSEEALRNFASVTGRGPAARGFGSENRVTFFLTMALTRAILGVEAREGERVGPHELVDLEIFQASSEGKN